MKLEQFTEEEHYSTKKKKKKNQNQKSCICQKNTFMKYGSVVVMPQTILPRRNRRCALSATGTWKLEVKDARGVTCFMDENKISLREVARFDEYKRD